MNNVEIRAALVAALAALDAMDAPAAEPVVYPRQETVNGTTYILKAPLNPKYSSGIYGTVFGQAGRVLYDPSNAPDGYPLRSPAGYPLFYPIGGDGKPVGAASVAYAGSTFSDDAAVEAYIKRISRTPEEQAAFDREWVAYAARLKAESERAARPPVVAPVEPGPVEVPIGQE